MLRLGECDFALAGGVSESVRTFGIFASFKSQGALASHADPTKASRPFDIDRTGIVVAEGGCLYVLERMADARARGAKIYGEIAGYAMNSDAHDFVLPLCRPAGRVRPGGPAPGPHPARPDRHRQHPRHRHRAPATCRNARRCGRFLPIRRRRISTTPKAISATRWERPAPWSWPETCRPSTTGSAIRRSTSIGSIRSARSTGLVINEPREVGRVDYILNNSFGMLGINSVVIVKRI